MTKHHKAAKTSLAISFTLLVVATISFVGASPAAAVPGDTPPVVVSSSYQNTIDTFSFANPAPDPSGIIYLPGRGTLLVSDSEVEEIAVTNCAANYAGVNLWEIDLDGTVVGTGTTVTSPAYSNEPTGLGLHEDGTLLVADDVQDDIDRVSAGNGGAFGDGNDTVVGTIQTQGINNDIEGVAWDSRDNQVFAVAGELGDETVYRLSLAGNVLAQFPLPAIATDSPGIAYHEGRDTLFVIDDSNNIFELDKFGIHVSTIPVNPPSSADPPGAGGHTLQDVAIVPGPGNTLRLFITDRRADPGEQGPQQQCINDGQIHEFTVSLSNDRTPSVGIRSPIPGATYTSGQAVSFSGIASDNDGIMTNNIVWRSSRDGQIGTGGSFSKVLTSGSHTITASVTDSNNNTSTDTVNITVGAAPPSIGGDTPGIVRGNLWFLNNGFDGGADLSFAYGRSTDLKVAGDWNGDGRTTPGIVRGNVWFLNNGFDGTSDIPAFAYGRSTDTKVVGDWNGDGTFTPGVVRGNIWFLNNGFDGVAEVVVAFGRSTDTKVVGDWDGNNSYTPGVVRGNIWYLNNGFDPGADIARAFGRSTDLKIVGDWDGDGDSNIGLVRSNIWFLDTNNDGGTNITAAFGRTTDVKVAGNWDKTP